MSKPITLPAPYKGINAKNAVNQLKKGEAVDLVNLIPYPDKLQLREGYTAWATLPVSGAITLLPYNSPSTGSKLFAACPEVTS